MFKKLVGQVNSKILDIFVLSNLIAFLFILVAPVRARQSNLDLLFVMNFLFVVGTIFISVITYKAFPKIKSRPPRKISSVDFIKKMLRFCTISSFLGVFSILFDRVYFRGISYADGLRAARYEWLDSGSGTVFGIVGNLAASFAYLGLFILAFYRRDLVSSSNKTYMIFLAFSVIGHASVNGGRSNLLLAAVVVLAGVIIGKNNPSSVTDRSGIILRASIIAICFFYVIHIILSSAVLGEIGVGEMTYLGLNELYGSPNEGFFSQQKPDFVYIILYIFSYLFHGQWTAQITFDLIDRPGFHSLISTPIILLESIGILEVTKIKPAFSDTGAFISLPGAFYHDFGWFGLFLLVTVLGSSLGVCMHFLNGSRIIGVFKMSFVVAVLMILFFSPILPAYGFAYFIFIIFSFIFSSVIGRLFLGGSLRF